MSDDSTSSRRSILLVGPGFRFFSGLAVYTCRLANAMVDHFDVSVVLLDRLVPERLFPGEDRVGQTSSLQQYDPRVKEIGRVDWFWIWRIVPTVINVLRTKPDVIVAQWWTAATMHTYLLLALVARAAGLRFVIEFHEIQDTGEAAVPGVARYAKLTMPVLLRLASGALVHNDHDLALLRETYGRNLDRIPIEVAPHGPLDHLDVDGPVDKAPGDATELLCFGLIRPYKGTEDAVAAFEALGDGDGVALSVVGETWENYTAPAEAIAASPRRNQITFVNRYVSDDEAAGFFARADAVVLPYRRGSASGPLHIAMAKGLWVIMYAVGGLVEAVQGYEGALLVEPGDIDGLATAMRTVMADPRRRFTDPHSWDTTAKAIDRLIAAS